MGGAVWPLCAPLAPIQSHVDGTVTEIALKWEPLPRWQVEDAWASCFAGWRPR